MSKQVGRLLSLGSAPQREGDVGGNDPRGVHKYADMQGLLAGQT